MAKGLQQILSLRCLGLALLCAFGLSGFTSFSSLQAQQAQQINSTDLADSSEVAPVPELNNNEQMLSFLIGEYNFITTDALGNLFAVNSRNEVEKYNKMGELQYKFSNTRNGKIGWVDATNPMKVLVYYPEYMLIEQLDVTLSSLGILELLNKDYFDVPAICRSGDNNIWIYDNINGRIDKMGETGEIIEIGDNLINVLGFAPLPVSMVQRNNRIFMNDPERGIHVFDLFGTYETTLEYTGIEDLQVRQEQVLMLKDDILTAYNMQLFQENILGTQPELRQIRYAPGRAYQLREKGIVLFKQR